MLSASSNLDGRLGGAEVPAGARGEGRVLHVQVPQLAVVLLEAVQHQLLESGTIAWRISANKHGII